MYEYNQVVKLQEDIFTNGWTRKVTCRLLKASKHCIISGAPSTLTHLFFSHLLSLITPLYSCFDKSVKSVFVHYSNNTHMSCIIRSIGSRPNMGLSLTQILEKLTIPYEGPSYAVSTSIFATTIFVASSGYACTAAALRLETCR